MSDKSDKLKDLVSKMVREQVIKTVPLLKEAIMKSLQKEIKYQISEAVNEKLMKVLLEGNVAPRQQSPSRSVATLTEDSVPQQSKRELEAARMKIKAQILAEQNPMIQGIYEDILSENVHSESRTYAPGQIPVEAMRTENGIIDSDDEGVNLDSFPEFTRRLR